MLKFFYNPGSCSLASHIALEESGLAYEPVLVSLPKGENATPEYLAINPLRRVPALAVDDAILTENVAILTYVAGLVPEQALLPAGGLERARAYEWLSLCSSTLHVAFRTMFRPGRFVESADAQAQLTAAGLVHLTEVLEHVDRRLAGRPFALGERYSLCDAYLTVFYLWTGRDAVAGRLPPLSNYAALARRVCERPAVRRALAREGLEGA